MNIHPDDVVKRLQEADEPVPVKRLYTGRELQEYEWDVKHRSPYTVPHNVYRCQWEDRWCVIAVSTDEEWQSFCKVIGNPQWTTDPRFDTFQGRKENEEELDRLIATWTVNRTSEEVMSMMQAAGVPAGIVATGEDLIEHDLQLKHRHVYHKLDHPEIGTYHGVAPSFEFSKCPVEVERSPLLGEHNESALKEILGMSDEEIKELIIEQVIE